MRKIVLIALTSLPLLAGFFPSTVNTSIKSVSENSITMNSSFSQNGMSGVVVHNYGNNIKAITSRVVQTTKGTAKIMANDVIVHNELPTIKTALSKGDKVIGGYLYNNVLLLAPDANTYTMVTKSYNKNWIHPDLYATHLAQESENIPTKENLAEFAKKYHVGLIYIIKKDSSVLLDPISGSYVGKKSSGKLPSKASIPFFMRFDEINSGLFSSSYKGTYYDLMETL